METDQADSTHPSALRISRSLPGARPLRTLALRLVELAFSAALVSALTLWIGQDASRDLQNYHFYNPYAFLNDRIGWDVAPAQLQSFHNPTLDLPLYWMIKRDLDPRIIALLMALPAAIALFLAVQLNRVLWRERPPSERATLIGASLLIGFSGSMSISLIGSTMNEWVGAMFVLAALFVVIRVGPIDAQRHLQLVFLAGLLLGSASGLDVTAAPYAAAFCLTLVLLALKENGAWRNPLVYVLGAGVGFTVTAGHWISRLSTDFENPFFPYFNNWFLSPWWDADSIFVRSYGPHTLAEWFQFPFWFLSTNLSHLTEVPFRDWRIPFTVTVLILFGLASLRVRLKSPRSAAAAAPGADHRWAFLIVFWLLSFFIWALLFSNYRFAISLEVASGSIVVFALQHLVRRRWASAAAVAAAAVLISTTRYADWWRVPFSEHFFQVSAPQIPEGALIITIDAEPVAYVLPFLREDARFVGANNNFNSPTKKNALATKTRQVIAEHEGPMFSLSLHTGIHGDVLEALGLKRLSTACRAIITNMRTSPLELCEVVRKSYRPGSTREPFNHPRYNLTDTLPEGTEDGGVSAMRVTAQTPNATGPIFLPNPLSIVRLPA